jgi:hypothetical protein
MSGGFLSPFASSDGSSLSRTEVEKAVLDTRLDFARRTLAPNGLQITEVRIAR